MNSMLVEDDRAEAVPINDLTARLSSAVTRPTDRDLSACFEKTLEDIVTILDADRGTLVEFSRNTSTIETTHTWARPGVAPFRLSMDQRRLQWLLGRCGPDE